MHKVHIVAILNYFLGLSHQPDFVPETQILQCNLFFDPFLTFCQTFNILAPP